MDTRTTDDGELLRRYVGGGDEGAFRDLVERHAGLVLGSARRRTGDPGLAEEVAQNVFALLARKGRGLVEHPSLGAWLYQTVRWECVRVRRNEKRRERTMREYGDQVLAEDAANDAVWERLAPVVEEVLDSLGEGDRRVVMLRYIEGRRVREVAGLLGKSEVAVRKQAERALAKLAEALGRRGVGVTSVVLAGGVLGRLCEPVPASVVDGLAGKALGMAAAGGGAGLGLGIGGALLPWAGAALVLGIAAVPVAMQAGRIAELEETVVLREAEVRRVDAAGERVSVEVGSVSAAGGAAGRRSAGGVPEGALTADRLVDMMIEADDEAMPSPLEMMEVYEAVGRLDAGGLIDLLEQVDELERGGRLKEDIRKMLVEQFLMTKSPAEAARYAVRSGMAEGTVAGMVEIWSKLDRDAVLGWLEEMEDRGGIPSKGLRDNTGGAVWAGLVASLVAAGELDESVAIVRGLPAEISGLAVGSVGQGLARASDPEVFVELLNRVENPGERQKALRRWVVAAASADDLWVQLREVVQDGQMTKAERLDTVKRVAMLRSGDGAMEAPLLIGLVPEAERTELAQNIFYDGAYRDAGAFEKILESGEVPAGNADGAYEGFARAQMARGKYASAQKWAVAIGDEAARNKLQGELGGRGL